jgi:hypothetical protein
MRVARKDLRPGQAFGIGYPGHNPLVLVVLDDKTEVDFWRGGITAFGQIAPHSYVELL